MGRVYKTVRLAHETKVWIDELISRRSTELQEYLFKVPLQEKLEKEIFLANPLILDGVSVNVTLNVTSGSVIEQAVRATKDFTVEQWNSVKAEMEVELKSLNLSDVSDFTNIKKI